jgi:hypothetical protein
LLKPLSVCPVCHTRVLPTVDGACPCCRRFNFNTQTAEAPLPGQAGLGPSSMRPPIDLHAAAVLHWRLIGLMAAFMLVVGARAYLRGGNTLLDPQQIDRNLQKLALSVVGLVVAVWLSMTSRQLARLLELQGWLNFWVVARESAAFFDDKHVPSVFLGPSLRALRPPTAEEGADEDPSSRR